MRVTNIKDYVRSQIPDGSRWKNVIIETGPDLPDHPEPCVVVTKTGGAGENTEGLFDDTGYQFRSVGEQMDPDSAEELAELMDLIMLSIQTQEIAGWWVTRVRRIGSPPSILQTDDAGRTHFVCNYALDVQSILSR